MKTKNQRLMSLGAILVLSTYIVLALANPAAAMHIAEGYLPAEWAAFWYAASFT
jgi:cobalt/nickel transport system permease protein